MRKRDQDETARRRAINRQAWELAQAHFEQVRNKLLAEAGLQSPSPQTRRRDRRRRRTTNGLADLPLIPDPASLRQTVRELLAAGGFDADPALKALAEGYLREPTQANLHKLRQAFSAAAHDDAM